MGVSDISTITKIGEFVGATNDFVDGFKDWIDKGDLPEASSLYTRLASIMTYASYFSKHGTQLGIAGAGLTLFTLEDDNNKLCNAINKNDAENIILNGLSVISDVSNIIAAIPIPQVKAVAIGIGLSAAALKEVYKNRKEIARGLKEISKSLSSFSKRLKYDPSIYLDLPNSAIRCHVVNGLNMNKGPMYQGVFSQNRLHQQIPTNNQQRTALMANDLHRKFKETYPNYSGGPAYLEPDFEWKKPGVLEWRMSRKKR